MQTRTATKNSTPCVEYSSLYQHPLIEEPPATGAPVEDRRRALMLTSKAASLCQACPRLADCLYDAVVKHDVAGFAGGTTQRQRIEIRARVGVRVQPEDLDTLAGVMARHHQVDHFEVVRMRTSNPHESLETIAMRLGCSLSTVKRHMRRARNGEVTPKLTIAAPTRETVIAAYVAVTTAKTTSRPATRRVA